MGITRHPLRAVAVDSAGADIAISSVAEAASFVPAVDVAAEPVELSWEGLFDHQDYQLSDVGIVDSCYSRRSR